MQVEQKLIDQLRNKNSNPAAGSKGIGNYIQGSSQGIGESYGGQMDVPAYRKSSTELGIFADDTVIGGTGVYRKPGMEDEQSVAEKAANAPDLTPEQRHNQMAVLANTTSPEDYSRMQEEGFSMSDTDSHTIVTVTDKIKVVMAKAGADVPGADLSEAELEQITGSKAAAQQIERALARKDLPATADNVEEAKEALDQAQSLGSLDDASISYMLKNDLEPTISNLYTAQYSSAGYAWESQNQIDFSGMEEQIRQIIADSGLEINEENIADSHWLVSNRIPLDKAHLVALQQLQELSVTLGQGAEGDGAFLSDVIDAIATAVAEGGRPADAMLVRGYSLEDRAQDVMDTVINASDEDLADCISRGEEITVENLRAAIGRRESGNSANAGTAADKNGMAVSPEAGEAALLTARRQLEEVRLAMTTEANYALLKKGISIDTKPLEQLVEDLKAQEDAYYRSLLESEGVEASDENVRIFADTTHLVEELQYQPAYALNLESSGETLPKLHETGAALQDTFTKANQSYETMMTTPRADLGDSVSKAFVNVDDILRDLGLETSEVNRRAVRILAYNETELTVENINQMKAVDEEVQRTFRGLTPAVTLEMIRQNQNPLDMTISGLHQVTEQIRAEIGHEDTERFSKFLYKLEQNHQISEEERSSYIGIYRLIAQVEKTDGAVIGSLINRGAEVTMRNLLSEVRTRHKNGMDYSVDDEFEGVSATYTGPKIDDQIQTAFQQNCLRDAAEQLAPEKMAQLTTEEMLDLTPEQLKELLEQTQADPASEEAYAREELSRYSEVLSASEDIYAYLDRYDMPNTMLNVMAASRMLQSPGQMFRSLWKGANAGTVAGLKEEVLERFGEALKNPEELADAQEALADTAEHVMEGMIIEERDVTSLDMRQLRIMSRQFTLAAKQSHEECYIVPMQTADEVTGVSLKIVRGRKEKGLVDILFDSDRLGKVAASFEAKESGITGIIATDSEETGKFLEEHIGLFAEALTMTEEERSDLRIACVPGLSLEHYAAKALRREKQVREGISTEETQQNPVQTKRLYQIAESFLGSIHKITSKN